MAEHTYIPSTQLVQVQTVLGYSMEPREVVRVSNLDNKDVCCPVWVCWMEAQVGGHWRYIKNCSHPQVECPPESLSSQCTNSPAHKQMPPKES